MAYVSIGCKELKTKYPITSGLTAGTTKQAGRNEKLMPEQGSLVSRKDRAGIN